MTRLLVASVPAWVVAVVGVVLVALLAPRSEYLSWVPAVFAVGLLTAFTQQLRAPDLAGLVPRLSVTSVGLVVLLGAGTIVLAVLQAVPA